MQADRRALRQAVCPLSAGSPQRFCSVRSFVLRATGQHQSREREHLGTTQWLRRGWRDTHRSVLLPEVIASRLVGGRAFFPSLAPVFTFCGMRFPPRPPFPAVHSHQPNSPRLAASQCLLHSPRAPRPLGRPKRTLPPRQLLPVKQAIAAGRTGRL